MLKIGQTVIYIKISTSHGEGKIPLNSTGVIIKIVPNPETAKALVDFGQYGKAILPLSCIKGVK